jgi:hypothetical protein
MSEHETETEFLRHLILYDDSEERLKLEQSIAQVRRDTHCVQRVASVTAVFPLLAMAGLVYAALLQDNFPYSGSGFALRALCVLGLASLICLVGFAVLLAVYSRRLNGLQKKARQLVIRLLETRLGNPRHATMPGRQRVFDDGGTFQGATERIGDAGSAILI